MFPPLKFDGSICLEWVNDAKTTLSAEDLAKTLPASISSTSSKLGVMHALHGRYNQILLVRMLNLTDMLDLHALLLRRCMLLKLLEDP